MLRYSLRRLICRQTLETHVAHLPKNDINLRDLDNLPNGEFIFQCEILVSKKEAISLIVEALNVGEDTATALSENAIWRSVKGNAVVYYQDDPTNYLYLLAHGHIRLCNISEDGVVTLLSIVTPGNCFGESGTLERQDHCDTAFAAGPTDLLMIDVAQLGSNQPHSQELTRALAKAIAKRYRCHVEFTRALFLPNLSLRLSHVLIWLLGELGNEISFKGNLVGCLGPIVTQRDLGSMARGTRENVNKVLKSWERHGIIALEDRHILVLDQTALEAVSRGENFS